METIEETSPSVRLNGTAYLCGGQSGLIVVPDGGEPPVQAGTNVPEILALLREFVIGRQPSGAAYLRLDTDFATRIGVPSPCGVLVFLRQTVRQERGRTTEQKLELHVYLLPHGRQLVEVSGERKAEIVRALVDARRQREPRRSELPAEMLRAERQLWDSLRRPAQEEVALGVRHGVWPLFAGVV